MLLLWVLKTHGQRNLRKKFCKHYKIPRQKIIRLYGMLLPEVPFFPLLNSHREWVVLSLRLLLRHQHHPEAVREAVAAFLEAAVAVVAVAVGKTVLLHLKSVCSDCVGIFRSSIVFMCLL